LRKEATKEIFSFRLLRRRKKYRKIFLIKEKQGRFFKKFTTENFLKNTLALD